MLNEAQIKHKMLHFAVTVVTVTQLPCDLTLQDGFRSWESV